jgi:hypothetical protein
VNKFLAVVFGVLAIHCAAQAGSSTLSYDVSGGSGSHNGNAYSEIHLGLNWYPTEWFNWRNSVFTQFGSTMNTIYGLDTAALFEYSAYTDARSLGVEFYAGPGLRFANEKSNAVFGKAGVTFAFGGLRLGGSVQQTRYFSSRTDKDNYVLPKDETQYFITISGGGTI